jgi:hypothetical protein
VLQLIRLVPVVVWLYLILAHAMSAFSLPLVHHDSNNRLQHPAHIHISIRHIRLSIAVSTTIPDLTILEFIFWTIKLRKQWYKNSKYDT